MKDGNALEDIQTRLVSQLEVPLIVNCYLDRVDSAGRGTTAFAEVLVDRRSIGTRAGCKSTPDFGESECPCFACSASSTEEVLGSAESSTLSGAYPNCSLRSIPAALGSQEGKTSSPSYDTSGDKPFWTSRPYANDIRLGPIGPSQLSGEDDNLGGCLDKAKNPSTHALSKVKQGNVLAVLPSGTVTSSEILCVSPVSTGLPIIRNEEYNALDWRKLSTRKTELSQASTSASKRPEILHMEPEKDNSCPNVGIQGMETVIATVSGYDGLVRMRLIGLINVTGAAYTGSLTQSNTHVVCWKFEGKKYDMAKKLGKSIINHRWFEDCMKAGKRLSEEPYKSSGEHVGSFEWDGPSSPPRRSKDLVELEQFRRPFFKNGHVHGELPPAVGIGKSSISLSSIQKLKEPSAQGVVAPGPKLSELDKGKKHTFIDLTSPTQSSDSLNVDAFICETPEIHQTGRTEEAGDIQTIPPSPCDHTPEQESDDFWNEVIRTYDGTGDRVADHSSRFLPELHTPGSIRRDQITGQGEAQTELATGPSGASGSDDMQACSSGNEWHGSLHVEDNHMTSHSEDKMRKRKTSFGESGGRLRRLLTKGEQIRISHGTQNTEEKETRGQPSLVARPLQLGVSSVDEDTWAAAAVDDVKESSPQAEERVLSVSPLHDITCVICHSDTKAKSEGRLTCGHKFCYPCIQRWADEAKNKSPTCPLCKLPFDFITVREIGHPGGDGVCTQVLDEKIVEVCKHVGQIDRGRNIPSMRTDHICTACGSTDTPELFLICTNCSDRACHTFCLDPPRPPDSIWHCNRCSQIQTRTHTREAYGRIFQERSSRDGRQVLGTGTSGHINFNQVPQISLPQISLPSNFGQISGLPPSRPSFRRRRQHSLHNFLLRNNG